MILFLVYEERVAILASDEPNRLNIFGKPFVP